MSLADQSLQFFPVSARVSVLRARGLRIKGKDGTNDTYTALQAGRETFRTPVAEKLAEPVWGGDDAAFIFTLPAESARTEQDGVPLQVRVFHRVPIGADKLLGLAVINVHELRQNGARENPQWFKLLNKAGKADKERGEVLLDIQFLKSSMSVSMIDLSDKSHSRLGKFKDKLKGKKKEGLSDSASAILPSVSQVLTDSEGEMDGEMEGESTKKKKNKLKSLFVPKSSMKRNSLSQSMSSLRTLPDKNSSISSSTSSGLNVESSEGKKKKKFSFLTHKRNGSTDSKASNQSDFTFGSANQNPPPQVDISINGSHVYRGQTQSEGVLEMEEEEEEEEEVENEEEEESWRRREEERKQLEEERRREVEEERKRKEKEEQLRKVEEEKERIRREREREEQSRRKEEEEKERMKVEREKEEHRRRMEEEEKERRRIEREKEEQKRRMEEEEKERTRMEREKEEERRRMEEEEEKERRIEREKEEQKRKMEEEERERRRMEREKEEERRRMEEEENERRRMEREREEQMRKMAEEKERTRMEEEEKERIRLEREKEEQRRRLEEEERERQRTEKEEQRRKLEEEEERMRMKREKEEQMRKLEEERKRKQEMEAEELRRKLAEENARKKAEEEEKMRIAEEERKKEEKKRVERERMMAEEKRIEMETRLANEKKAREEEERRIAEEKEKQWKEQVRVREEKERKRKEEEQERRNTEMEERKKKEKQMREEQERLKKEETVFEESVISQTSDFTRSARISNVKPSVSVSAAVSQASMANTNPFLDDELDASIFSSVEERTAKKGRAPSPPQGPDFTFRGVPKQLSQLKEVSKRQAPQPPDMLKMTREAIVKESVDQAGLDQGERKERHHESKVLSVSQDDTQVDTNPFTFDEPVPVKHKGPAPKPRSGISVSEDKPTSVGKILTEGTVHLEEPGSVSSSRDNQPNWKLLSALTDITGEDDLTDELSRREEHREDIIEPESAKPNSPSWANQDLFPEPLVCRTDGLASMERPQKKSRAPLPPNKPKRTGDSSTQLQQPSLLNKTNFEQAQENASVYSMEKPANNTPSLFTVSSSTIATLADKSQVVESVETGSDSGSRILPWGKLVPNDAGEVREQVDSASVIRQHAVKPLSAAEKQRETHESRLTDNTQPKAKAVEAVMKGPYSQLTQTELISMALRQQEQISQRDARIQELEQYIDNLLVRVMEEKPSILMSLNTKNKSI
ncbi:trichohyalin isoform X1 [Hemibagrus wyckioides]|uniref:trichohyalin isoform X1 n=1 Tax=Hemibagrus wyckioides TaxID=337641 RepID=UPI00266DA595|nr:trichohyalin isoform X1 [Hemibagrus wyckioides]